MNADLFDFRPDAERGRRLDAAVRADFSASLATVLRALADQGAVTAFECERLADLLASTGGPPGLIVAYSGLVEAIFGDRTEAAAECLAALRAAADSAPPEGMRPEAIRMVTLDDRMLGPGQASRYRGQFDDDPEAPLDIVPLEPAELARAGALAVDALDLLDRGVPELAGEIRAILREIVFARGSAPRGGETFQGASAFLAWGAVLLNAAEQPDRVTLAESLAHETGHSLLSGLSRGASLVENDGDERHSSPLRTDPRPLDGIVHATYVLARMHYCLARLLESGALTEPERVRAAAALAERRRAFGAGLAVVDRHARLTEVGRSAFEPARAYMGSLAP